MPLAKRLIDFIKSPSVGQEESALNDLIKEVCTKEGGLNQLEQDSSGNYFGYLHIILKNKRCTQKKIQLCESLLAAGLDPSIGTEINQIFEEDAWESTYINKDLLTILLKTSRGLENPLQGIDCEKLSEKRVEEILTCFPEEAQRGEWQKALYGEVHIQLIQKRILAKCKKNAPMPEIEELISQLPTIATGATVVNYNPMLNFLKALIENNRADVLENLKGTNRIPRMEDARGELWIPLVHLAAEASAVEALGFLSRIYDDIAADSILDAVLSKDNVSMVPILLGLDRRQFVQPRYQKDGNSLEKILPSSLHPALAAKGIAPMQIAVRDGDFDCVNSLLKSGQAVYQACLGFQMPKTMLGYALVYSDNQEIMRAMILELLESFNLGSRESDGLMSENVIIKCAERLVRDDIFYRMIQCFPEQRNSAQEAFYQQMLVCRGRAVWRALLQQEHPSREDIEKALAKISQVNGKVSYEMISDDFCAKIIDTMSFDSVMLIEAIKMGREDLIPALALHANRPLQVIKYLDERDIDALKILLNVPLFFGGLPTFEITDRGYYDQLLDCFPDVVVDGSVQAQLLDYLQPKTNHIKISNTTRVDSLDPTMFGMVSVRKMIASGSNVDEVLKNIDGWSNVDDSLRAKIKKNIGSAAIARGDANLIRGLVGRNFFEFSIIDNPEELALKYFNERNVQMLRLLVDEFKLDVVSFSGRPGFRDLSSLRFFMNKGVFGLNQKSLLQLAIEDGNIDILKEELRENFRNLNIPYISSRKGYTILEFVISSSDYRVSDAIKSAVLNASEDECLSRLSSDVLETACNDDSMFGLFLRACPEERYPLFRHHLKATRCQLMFDQISINKDTRIEDVRAALSDISLEPRCDSAGRPLAQNLLIRAIAYDRLDIIPDLLVRGADILCSEQKYEGVPPIEYAMNKFSLVSNFQQPGKLFDKYRERVIALFQTPTIASPNFAFSSAFKESAKKWDSAQWTQAFLCFSEQCEDNSAQAAVFRALATVAHSCDSITIPEMSYTAPIQGERSFSASPHRVYDVSENSTEGQALIFYRNAGGLSQSAGQLKDNLDEPENPASEGLPEHDLDESANLAAVGPFKKIAVGALGALTAVVTAPWWLLRAGAKLASQLGASGLNDWMVAKETAVLGWFHAKWTGQPVDVRNPAALETVGPSLVLKYAEQKNSNKDQREVMISAEPTDETEVEQGTSMASAKGWPRTSSQGSQP